MEAKLDLPDRLKADLKNVEGRYKPDIGEEEPLKKVLDTSVERAMYDEFVGGAIKRPGFMSDLSGVGGALAPVSNVGKGDSVGNFDDCLLERLTAKEKESAAMRRHLAEVSERATKLEKENKELRRTLDAFENSDVQDTIMALQDDNADLYGQLEEMEKFLKDYGLVWVGHGGTDKRNGKADAAIARCESKGDCSASASASGTTSVTATSGTGVPTLHDYPVPVIIKKIKELNEVLENEEAEVRVFDQGNGRTHRKAKFMRAEEYCETIPVRIFKDGLLIKRGPFRKCGSEGYSKFVRDVVDGYFPSEFRKEHPDGLIMAVVDCSAEDWDESKLEVLTRGGMLGRLPKTVLKDGEVFKVQGDVDALLGGRGDAAAAPKRDPVVVESSSRRDRDSENKENKGGGSDDPDVTVQVRWLDGSKALVLKMCHSDIVGDCREEIKRHFGGLECPPFKLRSAFPPRNLDDFMSLEEAGLTPRGVVVACKIV
jgi:hypothetical protein